jgi:peptidoglycan/xylan/chitin deacetylase (PgdA/CDA1 family)
VNPPQRRNQPVALTAAHDEQESDERIATLALWLDSGFELGNHTFGHASLNNVPLPAWEEDVIRGEVVTKTLLAQHGMKLRYFRHPYLDIRRDLQTRRAAETFLAQRGYQIAPVTLDAWDWMYAGAYDDARKRGDAAAAKSTGQFPPRAHGGSLRLLRETFPGFARLRAQTDLAAAWKLPGGRAHRRTFRFAAQARLHFCNFAGCPQRLGLQLAG